MRADAKAIHDRLLVVAGTVITEQGVDASMRDIARQADVGLATLLRHFPTRETLLETLLRQRFDELTAHAVEVEDAHSPEDGLVLWLRHFVTITADYQGVVTLMMRAIEEPDSALHASCVSMRASGARLLERAQSDGAARPDIDGPDLFALASAIAWLGDQPHVAARSEHLFQIIVSGILTQRSSPVSSI